MENAFDDVPPMVSRKGILHGKKFPNTKKESKVFVSEEDDVRDPAREITDPPERKTKIHGRNHARDRSLEVNYHRAASFGVDYSVGKDQILLKRSVSLEEISSSSGERRKKEKEKEKKGHKNFPKEQWIKIEDKEISEDSEYSGKMEIIEKPKNVRNFQNTGGKRRPSREEGGGKKKRRRKGEKKSCELF